MWANTIPLLFQKRVATYGNRIALRKKALGRWQEISWREYGQRVREVASGLAALGLRRGECVSIITENRPEWLYSDLGIMAAGGVTVGIYTTSSPEQCEYLLNHSEARFHIVEDEEQLDKLLRVRERLPLLERIVVIDLKGLRRFQDPMVISFEQLLAAGRELDAAQPSRFRQSLEEGKPEDVAILVYTSGTTGLPKAAMLSHETGQSEGREPEEKTEEPRDEAGDRESEQKGELEFQHQERGGVGADGHEAGMTEGDLPRVAGQEVQANSDDDMNGGEGQQVDQITFDHRWNDQEDHQQQGEPALRRHASEQPDLLEVISP